VSAQEIVEQLESLPRKQRIEVIKRTMKALLPQSSQAIERLFLRLEFPDVTEDQWRVIEAAEDGRLIELYEPLPELNQF
jgi:hypothetical protein